MSTHDRSTLAILSWLAAIGAGSAVELAATCGLSVRATRARLRAMENTGLSRSHQVLHGEPALHSLTRDGLRAAGRPELDPVSVSASTFAHQLAVARVAVALGERGHRVGGERELRVWERAQGRPMASGEVGLSRDGAVALHRPDLVCWGGAAPIAIEVELTVKAPARLRVIVRGWARSRLVGGVVYYATPPAERALDCALRSECAGERVAVLPLERAGALPDFPIYEFHPKRCVGSLAATAPTTQGDPGWPPSTEP